MYKLGVIYPDWHPRLVVHVVGKGIARFTQALATTNPQKLHVVRLVKYEEIMSCDAIIIFHHMTAGFTLYENPLYTDLIRKVSLEMDKIRILKFLWHVEPVPNSKFILSRLQTEGADIILTSSVRSMFGDKPVIYIPNGSDEYRIMDKTEMYSAPMNLRFMEDLGRSSMDVPGSRLDLMHRYVTDLDVHIWGNGWREAKYSLSKNWILKGQGISGEPFKSYKYVFEMVESDHLEYLNSIGYCSDRVGWALAHGCHLVTNLTWMHSAYRSVISYDQLRGHQYDPISIRLDAKSHSWKNIARTRFQAIYDAISQFKSTGKPTTPSEWR
jgi:hypothetical protein